LRFVVQEWITDFKKLQQYKQKQLAEGENFKQGLIVCYEVTVSRPEEFLIFCAEQVRKELLGKYFLQEKQCKQRWEEVRYG
jgi:plasmid rolling circle replication initiator protein Rep